MLTTLLSGLIVSSANGIHLGVIGRVGGYVLAALLDIGIFVAAFRLLQQVSALIVSHYLQNAQSTYGHFATVITILWWFYL